MRTIVTTLTFLFFLSLQANPFSKLGSPMINESSGIVRGKLLDEVFWTHNDSGDSARIFAVERNGDLIKPDWFKGDYQGIEILGANNIDWEDISVDAKGNLVIGEIGNNGNSRRDLCIYLVPEPNPNSVLKTRVGEKIRFCYPDQKSFPAKRANFDAEALFCLDGNYYILSKNRENKKTKLYAFPTISTGSLHVLKLKEEFNIDGYVTGADYSKEHSLLCVLTYNSVWLFKKEGNSFFSGKHYRKELIGTKQCEGICFNGDELIVTNEQGEIFSIPINSVLQNKVEPVAGGDATR